MGGAVYGPAPPAGHSASGAAEFMSTQLEGLSAHLAHSVFRQWEVYSFQDLTVQEELDGELHIC